MARRVRLDAELVRRGLARSREQAVELVNAGRVVVRGMVARKPATAVETDAPVLVQPDEDDPGWASRGAHKLIGALDAFEQAGLSVAGRRCLDAGASTGGFTDVLLRRDAAEVVAADVGYGQLVWRLRTDDRVRVLDRTNVRALNAEVIGGPVDLIVADLSFISLRLVLPALASCAAPGADLLPMVKPQFEVGRARLGSGGVVRDPAARVDAVVEVIRVAESHGLGFRGVVASPLPGPAGNVEYFLWLRRGHAVAGPPPADGSAAPADTPGEPDDIEQAVRAAVREGPR
ncbi:23S rRNA (cytidine1920-2'-O)/16S rRNA (cytidine1409-2'-O)-methyltransferase [Actinoalloteichus hoggarensis]|uniref:16S/23S rRNA (Cytidine-2'-O)-methyltransferase TlyA n=1 Tax=Actinoalloteichus hoggarensis TaxID=1470176 RepID=A0A221W705_9PSEU|nr:TlyA family RNA methyltransferase [Actinoalloteichus hoggarensis]ASO21426.1 16S/23S rRNA (cytidine-2'-O)-methyltransferase TlyA [Actinoalloteichus hoggarensis]MBB5921359.1 23S rRNA (cytidine1920-2'-O)/16S rRNA (cytidine1409-2'-O)-methyltransferase [Actinoalloteichus hoggarensis]